MSRWSRVTREHAQPVLFGFINLNSRRTTTLLLLAGSSLCAFLLTTQYHLAHPAPGANASQSLGRQAYGASFRAQSVIPTTAGSGQVEDDTVTGGDLTTGGMGSGSGWDDAEDGWGDSAWELPQAGGEVWNPLTPDPRPITEIKMNYCLSSPIIWDVCQPTSTLKEDNLRGKWIRVDKDLSKGIGMTYNYLYIRRLQANSQAPVITNITLYTASTGLGDEPSSSQGKVTEVDGDLRVGLWPKLPKMYMRYETHSQAAVRSSAGSIQAITELDVLYGGEVVQPLYGFEKVGRMITGGADDPKALGIGGIKATSRAGSSLAIRRASPVLPKTPSLVFSPTGAFKILQIADLHFSVGPGECRDMDDAQMARCKAVGADAYSLQWLEKAIQTAKPDLLVLSGDQLNGQKTSWSSQSTILKWAPVLWEKKIPWTVIFGNHDEEVDLTNDKQMTLMQSMPYFIGEAGPAAVSGTGNYVKSIRSGDYLNVTLFNLYFLDSHAYVETLSPWGKKSAYDWIKADQINWFKSQSARVSAILRPYAPATSRSTTYIPKIDVAHLPSSLQEAPSKSKAIAEGFYKTSTPQYADDRRRSSLSSKKRQIPIDNTPALDSGYVPAVMPDDGSRISDGGDESDLDIFDLYEADGRKVPTLLPAGPTVEDPLTAKPNAMMFFHIPLPESYETHQMDIGFDGKPLVNGVREEGPGSPKTNSGFFQQGIKAQGELLVGDVKSMVADEFWEGEFAAPTTGRPEVKVVANGHCHISEDCRRVEGVWLCFGGGGSYSGYGKSGFDRRMRVYDITDFGEKISTYHIVDSIEGGPKDRVGEIVLVGPGEFGVKAPNKV